MNVLILLINKLIDKGVQEVLGVDDSNESNQKANESDLENLSLQTLHILGASLVHHDTLSHSFFSVFVFFHDWLEYTLGCTTLPD